MIEVICPVCKKSFRIKPSQPNYGKGKYCSILCSATARQQQVNRLCQYCQKPFSVAINVLKTGGKYCSRICTYKGRKASSRQLHICMRCNALYFILPSQDRGGTRKYCSYVCSKKPEPLRQFFARHVNPVLTEKGCLLWIGRLDPDMGYGKLSLGKNKQALAHRFAYELEYGLIPKDKCVLHACDIRPCVNPRHLFLGNRADNNRDMVRKGRQVKGEQIGNAKLTEKKVLQIRALAKKHILTQEQIAQRFRVRNSTVNAAVNRRTWKHI